MPMYSTLCRKCKRPDVIYRRIAERDSDLPHCCGVEVERIITPTAIQTDIEPYESPKSGRMIQSRAQQREDLIRTGSWLYEPGMKRDIERNLAHEKAKTDRWIETKVDETVRDLAASGRLD